MSKDPNYGYLVGCNVSSYEGTLDYGFGGSKGPVISVKYSEIAIPLYNKDGTQLAFTDGSYACAFGMFPVGNAQQILFGDTFLRSAYVVYDLDSKQIALAPTIFGSATSNIIEIEKGGFNGASRVAPTVSVEQTGTAIAAHYVMGAAGDATTTALPISGSLGGLTASAPNTTASNREGAGASTTSSATDATSSISASAIRPATVPALMVVVACSAALVLLGGVITGID